METKRRPEFAEFPKIARLSRECIISEKLDGTNACVFIAPLGEFEGALAYHAGLEVWAGSRNRWITREADNFGFAGWVEQNVEKLVELGPGRHYGEWWGSGIQRGYGLKEKRFSLFNASRWARHGAELQPIPSADPRIEKWQERPPTCCDVVPVLYRGTFETMAVNIALSLLATGGSVAAPGYMNPEGVVVWHVAGNIAFKRTLDNDGQPKGRK